MDYRKLYKKFYAIDFDLCYEIHHINLDHHDNRIENLLLLPKDLHRRLHQIIVIGLAIPSTVQFTCLFGGMTFDYYRDYFQEIVDIYYEIRPYVLMREFEYKGIIHKVFNYNKFREGK